MAYLILGKVSLNRINFLFAMNGANAFLLL